MKTWTANHLLGDPDREDIKGKKAASSKNAAYKRRTRTNEAGFAPGERAAIVGRGKPKPKLRQRKRGDPLTLRVGTRTGNG